MIYVIAPHNHEQPLILVMWVADRAAHPWIRPWFPLFQGGQVQLQLQLQNYTLQQKRFVLRGVMQCKLSKQVGDVPLLPMPMGNYILCVYVK